MPKKKRKKQWNRWTNPEEEVIRRLNKKGQDSTEIAEHLSIRGFNRTDAAVRGWLQRNGITSKRELQTGTPVIEETGAKVLYYDIETTDFKADFGEIICLGYQWNNGPVQVVKISDYRGWRKLDVEVRDKFLVRDIADIISQADVLVGHYAKRFDHRFIQTRCLMHGLPPIPDTNHIDTWKIAKYQMAMTRNSLAVLCERLGCKQTKDKVDWRLWRRLKAHDQEAIDTISEYCKQDVRTQYDVTQKLLPIAKDSPNLNLLTGDVMYRCPSCGSRDVVQKGYRHTKIHSYPRFRCEECGKWSRGRKSVVDRNAERHMY